MCILTALLRIKKKKPRSSLAAGLRGEIFADKQGAKATLLRDNRSPIQRIEATI
jgi:hypothetical protein